MFGECKTSLYKPLSQHSKKMRKNDIVGPRISHVSLFISLKWIDIFNKISYRRAITVYKCLNGLLPSYLNDMSTNVSEISTRSTRSSSNNDFYLSKVKLALFKQSFAYDAAHIYNVLPKCIKQASSPDQFKKLY